MDRRGEEEGREEEDDVETCMRRSGPKRQATLDITLELLSFYN